MTKTKAKKWTKWNLCGPVNLRHDGKVQVRILESVGNKWVEVRRSVVPAVDLNGHYTVESWLRPIETTNRRRMEWRPRIKDILETGQECDCARCEEN